jgi:hypothetical protein
VQRPFYLQKWQKTENIPAQCVTKGLGQVNVDVYKADGTLYQSYPMTVTAEPAIDISMTRWDYLIDISAYPSGIYCPVLSVDGVIMRQSEWLDIKDKHPGTMLIEYTHTFNRFKYFFSGVPIPNMRVDAKLLASYPDATFTEYDDELADYEMLDGIPVQKQLLRLGNAKGVPDYVAMKVNMMLLLNGFYAEGHHITRTPESKMQPNKIQGSPLYSYDIEVIASRNDYGLETDAAGNVTPLIAAAMLEGTAFGLDDPNATIDIEVPLTP